MKNVAYLDSFLGRIGIVACENVIVRILFSDERTPDDVEEALSPVVERALVQLREYFAGERKGFSLPLAPEGTSFQKVIWDELQKIPYGETRTYSQIAALAGRTGACRAVGMANHANPIPIVIPCHRVIGANGSLTGYGGGLPVKRALLRLEGIETR